MLTYLFCFFSFSLPNPNYHTHIIQVVEYNIFNRYKESHEKYFQSQRNLLSPFLDGLFKEYLINHKKYDSNVSDTLQEQYKDLLEYEPTFSFAYDAQTLSNCLSQIPQGNVEVEIELYTNVTGNVNFGQLPYKVDIEISSDLDEDLENEILAFDESSTNYYYSTLMVQAIKTGKIPDELFIPHNMRYRRPKIHTKENEDVDFYILGGDFSDKINKFTVQSGVKLNIANYDFIVDRIDSYSFQVDGQYNIKSKSIVVSMNIEINDLVNEYDPTIVYFKIQSQSDSNFTIEFNQNNWTSIVDQYSFTLNKTKNIKQFGICLNIEDFDSVNLFLPKVNEIAGDVKIEIKHEEYFYERYYYFDSRGIEYDDEYDQEYLADVDNMVEILFSDHFPEYDSKLLSQKTISKSLIKPLKSYLLYNSNKEFKSQLIVESTGSWDQVKSLPNITFVKPDHVSVNKTNLQQNANWNEHIYEESNDYPDVPSNGGDNNKKKGKKSSSNKNDDDEVSSKQSSYTLANFSIHDVYVGASTILDFPLGFKFMQKARQTFGKFVPPPNFLHTAVWVGPYHSNNQTLGAIFVYGKYSSKIDDNTYLSKDGARSYVMSLRDFIEYFDYCNVKKLEIQRNLHLFDFIEEVRKSGMWNIAKYHWPTNNCQHFTATCIKIMKSTREVENQDDWANFPSSIYKALESNEIQLNKIDN
ncbi:hypothetical protein M9Y10_040405 [Tritrichomonas musculus]|uniref:PPPDE domain-containing protein n=1 Tax=Tritrichomonas musculus TaxID=1915356 RepID=A0ABR2GPK8_9EUKA